MTEENQIDKIMNEKKLTLDDLISPSSTEEQIYKVVKEFFSIKGDTDIRTKTVLQRNMVGNVIRAIFYAKECLRFEKYDNLPKISELVKEVILENLYTLNISINGMGRKQFFSFASDKKVEEKQGVLKKLFGGQ